MQSKRQKMHLRWPNTVFARAFADVIQCAHEDCKNKHVVNRPIIFTYSKPRTFCAIFLYLFIKCSVLMPLFCYYNDMLVKVTTQTAQKFLAFLCY